MGDLTSAIAHQVKQPLVGVAINADAALHWLDNSPPNLDEARLALARIGRDARRAAKIVDAIRALFAAGACERDLIDIGEAVREATTSLRAQLREHGITLTCALDPAAPLVCGNLVQIEQCLCNLILNAIEAMDKAPDGQRDLEVSLGLDAAGDVLLEVADSGPGVDPDQVDRLFDAFFTTKPAGMGLGLWVCRAIAELHGGALTCVAGRAQGARFQLRLPSAQS